MERTRLDKATTSQEIREYFKSIGAPEEWADFVSESYISYISSLLWADQYYVKWEDVPEQFKIIR